MERKYYLLPMVDFTITVNSPFGSMTGIPLVWFEGQKGAVAAFTNKRKAQKIAKRLGVEADLIVTTELRKG